MTVPWFEVMAAHTYFGDYVPVSGGVTPPGTSGRLSVGGATFPLDPTTGLIPAGSVDSFAPMEPITGTFQVAPELRGDARYDWSQGCPQTINIEQRHATPLLSVDHTSIRVGDVVDFTLQAYRAGDVDPIPDVWTATIWQVPEWGSAFPQSVTSSGGHRQLTFRRQLTDVGVQEFHFDLGGDFWWDTTRSNTVSVDVTPASDQPPPALPGATPGAAPSEVTLGADVTSSSKDDNVTFTATVNPAPSSGRVIVYDGSEEVFAIDPDPGTGSGTVSAHLRAGDHVLRAEYQGSDEVAPSISDPLDTTVESLPMAITLDTSANPVGGGTSISVTASISPTPPAGTRLTWYWDDSYDTSQTLNGTTSEVALSLTPEARQEPYRIRAELIFDGPYADAHTSDSRDSPTSKKG